METLLSTSKALTQLLRRHLRDAQSARHALRLAARIAVKRGPLGLINVIRGAAVSSADYSTWVERYDTLREGDRRQIEERVAHLRLRPTISVIMPVYNTPPHLLCAAVESVISQIYQNWELCIADDNSTSQPTIDLLKTYVSLDHRIKIAFRQQNGHISAASNSALSLATGEWVAFLDHDDLLVPHALYCIADAINTDPDLKLIYSDEDKIDEAGLRRSDPYFKPDWNLDLFLSHNLITHLSAYRRDLVMEVGGFRVGVEGAQDYDLGLRCVERISENQIGHIPHVLYHWRIIDGSTAAGSNQKPYAMIAGEKALNDHFERMHIAAKATLLEFGYRVCYSISSPPPLVSIIIPTRNGKELVEICISSIVQLTSYTPYEILLVDNGSDDDKAIAYFGELERSGAIRLVRDDRPFNYSQLNNSAVTRARGTVLAFLNNDIEVITPSWLTTMVSIALQPKVGAVGAKLLYPSGKVQHAGVVLGIGGVAGHVHVGIPRDAAGHKGRAALASSFSAVTGACLVVRREYFEAVGGFNEAELKIAFNDVDLCLRLREHGLRNVWTPFAELYHHESATRGYETTPEKIARFEEETRYMRATWGDTLASDPAYNANLTLSGVNFQASFPPRSSPPWRLDIHPR